MHLSFAFPKLELENVAYFFILFLIVYVYKVCNLATLMVPNCVL